MDIKISIPGEPGGKNPKVPMTICINSSTDSTGRTHWLLKLVGDGVNYLNRWLTFEGYDDTCIEFSTYTELVEYLTVLKKDIESAWENYNEESKHINTSFDDIKKIFADLEWKEEN